MRNGSWVAAALLTAALLPLAAGCAESDRPEPAAGAAAGESSLEEREGWALRDELRWLRSVGAWQDQFAEFVARVDETAESNGLAAALTPLASCGQMLVHDVGPAPTQRLERVRVLLKRACVDWRRAGVAAMSSQDADPALVRTRVKRALHAMEEANGMLPPGESQPLEDGDPSASESRVVPRLSEVATRLAGRRAEVRCWTRADWIRLVREERELSVSRVDRRAAGITSIATGRESLRHEICARLASLAEGKLGSRSDEDKDAFALLVLAHESQHAAGVVDEVVADCRGMQTMRKAGVLLGMSPARAQRLAEAYWRMYPKQPRIYFSPHCRPGGRLDLHRDDSTWP
jgi:hypothetical protein